MKKTLRVIGLCLLLLASGCDREGHREPMIRHASVAELNSFLSEARAHYIAKLQAATKDYRGRFEKSHPEVLFDFHESTDPVPFRYRRYDMASGSVTPPNVTNVHTRPHQTIDPFVVSHPSGIDVEMHTLVWNQIQVSSTVCPSDLEPLALWTTRWIDFGDTKAQDDLGFSEVIHSVAYPHMTSSTWTTTIDFGSAPISAFDELLDALAQMGIRNVEIATPNNE